jgi:GrpB-like predicted nucleotidyltransferase (UPF0157 family)
VDSSPRVVEIVPYDPTWPELFDAERGRLAEVLPTASSIEHIGSTSVPGLAAKPIIDVLVVVPEVAKIASDVEALARIGYVFRPSAFAEDPQHLFFVKNTDGRRTHHLHVFGASAPHPHDNRTFRDYLRAHPDVARRYEEAKRRAADAHPDSRARYGEAKEGVMVELLTEARKWAGRQF